MNRLCTRYPYSYYTALLGCLLRIAMNLARLAYIMQKLGWEFQNKISSKVRSKTRIMRVSVGVFADAGLCVVMRGWLASPLGRV